MRNSHISRIQPRSAPESLHMSMSNKTCPRMSSKILYSLHHHSPSCNSPKREPYVLESPTLPLQPLKACDEGKATQVFWPRRRQRPRARSCCVRRETQTRSLRTAASTSTTPNNTTTTTTTASIFAFSSFVFYVDFYLYFYSYCCYDYQRPVCKFLFTFMLGVNGISCVCRHRDATALGSQTSPCILPKKEPQDSAGQ